MPLITDYQESILQSLKKCEFQRVFDMMGSCHDAFIGEWINWWLRDENNRMICNPARQSRAGSRQYIADLLFLERFPENDQFEVKGVAEVENSESKFLQKIRSLKSYENYTKKGERVYPNLEFSIFCYCLNPPNEELVKNVREAIFEASENSKLVWIVCEIDNSLREIGDYSRMVHMPKHVKDYDCFWYYRRFTSLSLFSVKHKRKIGKFSITRKDKSQCDEEK